MPTLIETDPSTKIIYEQQIWNFICAHCFVVSDLKDNDADESEDEKESDGKGSELSSDSELSLGDEPLMEIQVSV